MSDLHRAYSAPSPQDTRDTQVIPVVADHLVTSLNGEKFADRAPAPDEVVLVNIAEVRRRFGI